MTSYFAGLAFYTDIGVGMRVLQENVGNVWLQTSTRVSRKSELERFGLR
jgi:hypothetical protein